jgi:site-specific recombinase
MHKPTLQEYLQTLKIKQYHGAEAVLLLRHIIAFVRPAKRKLKEQAIANFSNLIDVLENDNHTQNAFYNLVGNIIIDSNITDLLTDNGIVTGATFAQQVKRIINEKIIPPYQEAEDINTVLQTVFFKKWDWQWVSILPKEQLQPIINGIHENISQRVNDLNTEMGNAAKVVSYRIANLGLDKEILTRANKKEELITPFTQQNIELNNFLNCKEEEKEASLNQLRVTLILCAQSLVQLEKNSVETGTSINQTFLLRRLTQNINRLKFIISFLQKNKAINTISVSYFLKDAIKYLKTKNDLRSFISNNLNLLAYRIVDHTKDTGENYITSTRKEYGKMFLAACGGGAIVSILVMLKFKIGTLHLPVFWEGFLYSLNYAMGFIAIQLSNFTLATKQPAMTAATIASTLKGTAQKDFVQMAITISKVCRTQFVSIFGNVFFVMPFTLLWLFLYEYITGVSFLNEAAAEKQLIANHPLLSLSILYAAIAGLFLFISGLVSGYVDNRMVYAKIPERLPNQPLLKKIVPKKWLPKLIRFLQVRSGAIFGNATLGLLLGMASFFGKILGIPFDIRHITFAAGNVTMGIYGGGSSNLSFILACFLCVLLIGIFNLLVSFSFAFYLAMKARNLHLSDYPELSKTVFKHFFSTPKEFFFPPKKGNSAFAEKQDATLFKSNLGV